MQETAKSFLSKWNAYAQSRLEFLKACEREISNRDPLAEAAEKLVEMLEGGKRADNCVQEGWDIEVPNNGGKRHLQVKYLANRSEKWINWHTITSRKSGAINQKVVDEYALVIVIDLVPKHVLLIKRNKGVLLRLYERLGKRHKDKGETIQFTKANYRRITECPEDFEDIVRIIDLHEK